MNGAPPSCNASLTRLTEARLQERGEIERQRTSPFFASFDFQRSGMKCMTRQEKPARKFWRPTRLDKLKIKFFVGPINLVADDRMA
jgi:hypothetical protein